MDATTWNQFVTEHAPPSGAFLQSWEWGEFQRAVGRDVRRYAHIANHTSHIADHTGHMPQAISHKPTSAAQIISYPIRGRFYGWDLHRGPVGDSSVILSAAKDLDHSKGIFLHIEPGSRCEVLGSSPAKNRQPQTTLVIDLTKSEDELLAAMHEKTRYNIRLATKHGVTVEQHTTTTLGRAFDDFIRLLTETANRDRFHLHSATYYRKMLETIPNAALFTASHAGETLAAAITISFAGTMTYLHGASGDRHRNLMAPHLLHWEIMRQAKAGGDRAYDFWGIRQNFADAKLQSDKSRPHPWDGITRFKTGFRGEVISMPEALELPLRPFWYSMYRLARTFLLPS